MTGAKPGEHRSRGAAYEKNRDTDRMTDANTPRSRRRAGTCRRSMDAASTPRRRASSGECAAGRPRSADPTPSRSTPCVLLMPSVDRRSCLTFFTPRASAGRSRSAHAPRSERVPGSQAMRPACLARYRLRTRLQSLKQVRVGLADHRVPLHIQQADAGAPDRDRPSAHASRCRGPQPPPPPTTPPPGMPGSVISRTFSTSSSLSSLSRPRRFTTSRTDSKFLADSLATDAASS